MQGANGLLLLLNLSTGLMPPPGNRSGRKPSIRVLEKSDCVAWRWRYGQQELDAVFCIAIARGKHGHGSPGKLRVSWMVDNQDFIIELKSPRASLERLCTPYCKDPEDERFEAILLSDVVLRLDQLFDRDLNGLIDSLPIADCKSASEFAQLLDMWFSEHADFKLDYSNDLEKQSRSRSPSPKRVEKIKKSKDIGARNVGFVCPKCKDKEPRYCRKFQGVKYCNRCERRLYRAKDNPDLLKRLLAMSSFN